VKSVPHFNHLLFLSPSVLQDNDEANPPRLLIDNHDLQVRFRWQGEGDLAVWDNRSTFHTATYDIEGQGERYGVRTVSVGEAPYFDPESRGRREALSDPA
jgi:hypothetical protein